MGGAGSFYLEEPSATHQLILAFLGQPIPVRITGAPRYNLISREGAERDTSIGFKMSGSYGENDGINFAGEGRQNGRGSCADEIEDGKGGELEAAEDELCGWYGWGSETAEGV